MSACIVCTNEALRGMSMIDKDLLTHVARELVQGMIVGRASTFDSSDSGNFQMPPRRGTCVVERCAQVVEALCGSCRKADCQRCAIATELRAAEEHINAERDAELVALGLDDETLDAFVDKLIGDLCADHAAFGAALAGQWYSRRSFLTAAVV